MREDVIERANGKRGIYGVIDQELMHSGGRSIGMFVRAGDAPSDVNFVH